MERQPETFREIFSVAFAHMRPSPRFKYFAAAALSILLLNASFLWIPIHGGMVTRAGASFEIVPALNLLLGIFCAALITSQLFALLLEYVLLRRRGEARSFEDLVADRLNAGEITVIALTLFLLVPPPDFDGFSVLQLLLKFVG
jgi:hypothetical protein